MHRSVTIQKEFVSSPEFFGLKCSRRRLACSSFYSKVIEMTGSATDFLFKVDREALSTFVLAKFEGNTWHKWRSTNTHVKPTRFASEVVGTGTSKQAYQSFVLLQKARGIIYHIRHLNCQL
jgi:hypothetical protein